MSDETETRLKRIKIKRTISLSESSSVEPEGFMNNTIVIYQSKYGYTERYAKWIAQELNCEVISRKDATIEKVKSYDTIIFGSGIYGGKIEGIDLITRNFDQLKSKSLVLFTCSMCDPVDPVIRKSIWTELVKTVPEEILSKMHVFHYQGGMDFERLNIGYKLVIGAMAKVLGMKDPAKIGPIERELINATKGKVDHCDRSKISQLVEFVRSLPA